jgi:hypothetical protein
VREDVKQVAQQMQEELSGWRAALSDLIGLADQGNPQGALDVSTSRCIPFYEALRRDAERMNAIQEELLAHDSEAGAAVISSSRWIQLGLLGLSLAVGAGVVLIVRHTSRPRLPKPRPLVKKSRP